MRNLISNKLILLAGFLSIMNFMVIAGCDPPCKDCQGCRVDGTCVKICGSNDTCCTGCGGECYVAYKTMCCHDDDGCPYLCSKKNCMECGDNGCKSKCDPNEACCDGECYDTRTQGCCNDEIYSLTSQKCCPSGSWGDEYVCNIDYSCCEGECCQNGCCGYELEDELWCISRGCGCDPFIGSCGDKNEMDAPTVVYYAFGIGSKCRIPQGEILCYKWRDCQQTGYHAFELCYLLDPDFPEGYCTSAPSVYCQDCAGIGIWTNNTTSTSARCQ